MPTLTDITDAELGAWKSVCKTPSDKALIQIAFNLAHIYDMLKAIKEDTMCYHDYFSSMSESLYDIGYPPEYNNEPQ